MPSKTIFHTRIFLMTSWKNRTLKTIQKLTVKSGQKAAVQNKEDVMSPKVIAPIALQDATPATAVMSSPPKQSDSQSVASHPPSAPQHVTPAAVVTSFSPVLNAEAWPTLSEATFFAR